MIISHKYRFVFVEVPHTGSHSVSEQLVRHYGGQPILRKHANLTQFLARASADEKTYFKFATVRNPLDSATTDYEKLKGNHRGQFTNPAMRIENGGHVTRDHIREFEFIRDNQADFPTFFKKFRNKLYNNWFLVGHTDFDYVMRFEALQDSFAEVLERVGARQVEPIPHVNPTRGKKASYVEYYTPDTLPQVARCYGPFMEKWGYAFPSEWGDLRIPAWSRLEFRVLDGAASFAARRFELNPDHPVLSRAKKLVDLATSRI